MTVQTGQGTWVVPSHRAVWIPDGIEHAIAMSGWVSMRTLYLQPELVRALPRRCGVVAVSPLLRELVLHAVARGPVRGDLAEHRRLVGFLVDPLREEPGGDTPVDALARGESVTSMALEVGYDSPSAFIATFKSALGTTPGSYSKGQKDRGQPSGWARGARPAAAGQVIDETASAGRDSCAHGRPQSHVHRSDGASSRRSHPLRRVT